MNWKVKVQEEIESKKKKNKNKNNKKKIKNKKKKTKTKKEKKEKVIRERVTGASFRSSCVFSCFFFGGNFERRAAIRVARARFSEE